MVCSEKTGGFKEKLRQETGLVAWNHLRPQAGHGVLFEVGAELELVEVAAAVAADRTEQVRDWLARGLLLRPEGERLQALDENGGIFQAVIVKPYVFFQVTLI